MGYDIPLERGVRGRGGGTLLNLKLTNLPCFSLQRDSSASYATHLIADLPPSYDSAISVQPATLSSRTSLTVDQSDELKFEEPPPYSIVISSINLRNPTTEEISHAPKPNILLSAGKETTISSRDS